MNWEQSNIEVKEFNVPGHEVRSDVHIPKRHVDRGVSEDLLQGNEVAALDYVVTGIHLQFIH
jgi:hypothetical protein